MNIISKIIVFALKYKIKKPKKKNFKYKNIYTKFSRILTNKYYGERRILICMYHITI